MRSWATQHPVTVGVSVALAGAAAMWLFFEAYLSPHGFKERIEVIKAAQSLAAFVAAVVGGIWAYVKIVRRREHAPRVDFTVELAFIGEQQQRWLVDVRALVNNEGLVRHTFRDFSFELRALYHDDDLVDDDETIGGQTRVPHLLRRGSWLPENWTESFIEPGLRTRYSYVTSVPVRASFVLLHGLLLYGDGDGRIGHTAECLVEVPRTTQSAATTP
jgi:hypothetical protein